MPVHRNTCVDTRMHQYDRNMICYLKIHISTSIMYNVRKFKHGHNLARPVYAQSINRALNVFSKRNRSISCP